MDISEVDQKLNQLALELTLADLSFDEEFNSIVNRLKALECKECVSVNPAAEVFNSILRKGCEKIVSLGNRHNKIVEGFTFFVSFLQNLVHDVAHGGDVSGYLKNFEREFDVILEVDDVSVNMSAVQFDMLPEFISDVNTLLTETESDILSLEKARDDELVNRIFRSFHSLKGEANLIGLTNLGRLAHKVEDLLERVRSHKISFDSTIASFLLDIIDIIKSYLSVLSSNTESAFSEDFGDILRILDNVLNPSKDVSQIDVDVLSDFDKRKRNKEGIEDSQSGRRVYVDSEGGDEDGAKKESSPVGSQAGEWQGHPPVVDLSDGGQLLSEFISEASEHLNTAEEAILILEKNPEDKESIDKIFRAFHTIKGVAGFLELNDIKQLAHSSESLLDLVRKGILQFEKDIADIAFSSIDGLRKLIELLAEQIANDGKLVSPYYDISQQIEAIDKIIKDNADKNKKDIPHRPVGEILIDEERVTPHELDMALEIQKRSPNKKVGELLQEMHAASAKDIKHALDIQKGNVTQNSIKINVDKLDLLIDLVGELVISETQVIQNPCLREIEDRRLNKDLSELDRITRLLQEVAMGMRLVPVRPTFQKMLRIIRDLARRSNKEVEVILSGEDTEIDKNMVELISDPLIHMVRNSVDHGIEEKEERIRKGKSPVGRIELAAYHKGDNVIVEIKDDGAGLNKEKILTKAIERGLIQEGETLPDNRIYNMIFEPGFSTADKISDISGRGVGMDVVKRNIEQLRGKIEIETEKDKGSVFSIHLPITLAIIEGIIFTIGVERYILPINSVVEFINPQEKFLTNLVGKGEVYKLHDRIYPVIRLAEYFDVRPIYDDFEKSTLCLIESDYGRAFIVIDELLGQQQVVIKSLGHALKDVKGISAGAILGDGRVGLILDVNGIVSLAREHGILHQLI